jgi:argininosuccinate lyase
MWRHDIRASLAHATMLARQGIISGDDLADIERGMAQVAREIEAGSFVWSLDLEDVHLNIEKRLTALVGDAGKRLHTGRSRNDQVATDIRLYLRDAIDDIARPPRRVPEAPARSGREGSGHCRLPGFTHLQVAQPVTFGHHLLAYFEMTRVTPSASPTVAAACQPPAARRSRAGRHDLPDRPRVRRRPAGLSTASAKTRSMPFPTAISRSNSVPPARC